MQPIINIIQALCALAVIALLFAMAFQHRAPFKHRMRSQGGFISLPGGFNGKGRAAARRGVYRPVKASERLSHNISPSKSGPLIIIKNANSFVSLDAIAQKAIRVAAPEFFPVRMMCHDVSDEFKQLNDTVTVKIPGTWSADDVSSSYTPADATETGYTVSLNKNKGKCIKLSDLEARKGLDYYQRTFNTPLKNAVKSAVISDMATLTTTTGGGTDFATTYDATVAAASFDWAAVVDLKTNLGTAKAGPDRFLILRETYTGNLLKDATVKTLLSGGFTDGERFLREGYLGNLAGFDTHEFQDWPTTLNMRGFYFARESFAAAFATPVVPEDFPGEIVNVTDEDGEDESGNFYKGTGITMQFRRWYNTGDNGVNKGYRLSAEALYGIRTAVLNKCGRIKAS